MTPAPASQQSSPLLALEEITHRYGALTALEQATCTVRAGTIHALLGENGAGKTTLMRVAFGLVVPAAGVIRVSGVNCTISSPAAALKLGIGMVHQHFSLIPAMTVAENVALGGRGRFAPAVAAARVREVADRAGFALDPHARVSTLSVAAQQKCEIVKALARDVRLLILDEPNAVLSTRESNELRRWMRAFADAGGAVVLITHKLRDALEVADDVTVLRRGRSVFVGSAAESSEESLRAAMVGERATAAKAPDERAIYPSTGSGTRASVVVLAAQGVHYADHRGVMRVRDVSLEVTAGEIVGIVGVEGAGQAELLRLLAGRLTARSGRVTRPNRLGFVPEDRHRDALMLDAALDENIALRGAGIRKGWMSWRSIRASTALLLNTRDIRALGPEVTARTLSGGNQQKLIVARELADAPEALVVENPSRGLDFQAAAAVVRALEDARRDGAGIVLYSSDLDEVLQLADRVLVMFNGTLVATARDRDAVTRAMFGGA